MPSPARTTQSATRPYDGEAAASPIPIPPRATPAGSSQIAPRRSDQSPNSGWMTELETDEASTSTAASVYESPKRSTRNGSSAGSAPPAKSTARWPVASAPIARRSISVRMAGA